MSFRTRLNWFFVVIVIVPMLAVAVVVFRLVADSERGKSDARLAQAQVAAERLFDEQADRAEAAGRTIARDPALAAAVEAADRARIEKRLVPLARQSGAEHVVLRLGPIGTFEFGGGDVAIAADARTALIGPEGSKVGTLDVSMAGAESLARALQALTRLEVLVFTGDRLLASTLPAFSPRPLPERGETVVAGQRYRVSTFSAPKPEGGGQRLAVRLLVGERSTRTSVMADSLFVIGLLLAFLALAFVFALVVSRALQTQIQRLLEAAKRFGGGEYAIEVPTEGNDEFAALGKEFNSMARQLEARLEELRKERERLQHAVRRVGESFAMGLDRDALLTIVVKTAVDGIGAEAGRASVRATGHSGPLVERASTGDVMIYRDVLHAAESTVIGAKQPAEATVGHRHGLAHPLMPSDGEPAVLGVISVARDSRPFTAAETDLFNYLASQAAVSIENVDLHETVQRQAVTDELTGLFNHRRFQEVIDLEIERARRFGTGLGLIMLDIDNFKAVNDTYGHLQGDFVLKEVARVLRNSAREIDEPARYGGEEMAVALPQTDLDGAFEFAERLRRRIEELRIRRLDGSGETLSVTASFGAAALPESGDVDKATLVNAADQALYRAKGLGKNRVVKAG